MSIKNRVFIAQSLDGYIADANGGIDWLNSIPNPDKIDMGYSDFMEGIDALVMGRNTFETVCGFDIDWPYSKPVFVLSKSLESIPEKYSGKAYLLNGSLAEILDDIHARGFKSLYIDGGQTIQNFLRQDLVDELIITTIPILLGEGIPLFSSLDKTIEFKCIKSEIYLDSIPQNHYIRTNIAH